MSKEFKGVCAYCRGLANHVTCPKCCGTGVAQHRYQRVIADRLKALGFSLRGCQLVHDDFAILNSLTKGHVCRPEILRYLDKARRVYIQPGPKTDSGFQEYRYQVIVDDENHQAVSVHHLSEAQAVRLKLRR